MVPYSERQPSKSYAAINTKEEVRLNSSSGGIFSSLAEKCVAHGGTVFGARFTPSWTVEHSGTNQAEDIPLYRGSKYVQSKMGCCFEQVKELLEEGKPVMFVGTSCQVAGLHHYLKKSYDHLLTLDIICHGVSSPQVWNWYINDVAKTYVRKNVLNRIMYAKNPLKAVRSVTFRDKTNGWKHFNVVIKFGGIQKACLSAVHYENPYMRTFLLNINLRPSCYQCPAKSGRSHSDITLADFWNVDKVVDGFDDDKGTSLVLINTEKGAAAFRETGCRSQEVNFEEAIHYNPSWRKSYEENEKHSAFFQEYTTSLKNFI